jgi:hypothetical protein
LENNLAIVGARKKKRIDGKEGRGRGRGRGRDNDDLDLMLPESSHGRRCENWNCNFLLDINKMY